MKATNKIKLLLWGGFSLALFGTLFPVHANGATTFKAGYHPADVPAQEEMVAGFIVKARQENGTKLDKALQERDASSLSTIARTRMVVARHMSGHAHVLRMDRPIPLSEARAMAARMMKEGSVELAEPDRIIYPAVVTPSDPSYGAFQWHYKTPSGSNQGGINLPVAWDFAFGNGVTVAVLDTGYRPHEDLGNILQGYDFITKLSTANDVDGRDSNAQDPGDWVAANECGSNSAKSSSWHGTHVIGTIAALMNNGKGGTGVAPNVKILPVRVMGKCGGATSDIVDAMRWAAGIDVPGVPHNSTPARVLNMSLGAGGACSAAFQSAVDDVTNAGKMIVVSAGNDSASSVSQPANCRGVLAVTAHTITGDNANYANIGPEVFISAPGGGCGTLLSGGCDSVYSTWNDGTKQPGNNAYGYMNGTSMAAPHVTGTIALMLSRKPDLTPEEVKSYLRASSREHPPESACTLQANADKCGAGLLDAGVALTMLATGIMQPTAMVANSSQVAAPGTAVSLSGGAFLSGNASANSHIVSYQWTPSSSNPAPVTLTNADQLNASFTAPEQGGAYVFRLEVKDDVGNIGRAMAIVRVNTPPQLDAIGGQSVEAGKDLHFKLSGTDKDGDSLIFYAVSLPKGASLSADGTFSWPDAAPVGTYEVTYYASDNYQDSPQGKVTIQVLPSSGGGGGGSMDDWSLFGLLLTAGYLRLRRAGK